MDNDFNVSGEMMDNELNMEFSKREEENVVDEMIVLDLLGTPSDNISANRMWLENNHFTMNSRVYRRSFKYDGFNFSIGVEVNIADGNCVAMIGTYSLHDDFKKLPSGVKTNVINKYLDVEIIEPTAEKAVKKLLKLAVNAVEELKYSLSSEWVGNKSYRDEIQSASHCLATWDNGNGCSGYNGYLGELMKVLGIRHHLPRNAEGLREKTPPCCKDIEKNDC